MSAFSAIPSRACFIAILFLCRLIYGEEQVWTEWIKPCQTSPPTNDLFLFFLRPVQDDFLVVGKIYGDPGLVWTTRLRNDGSPVWNRLQPDDTYTFFDAVTLPDGSFITVGDKNATGEFLFTFFNADGSKRSQTNFLTGNWSVSAKIVPAHQGGYLGATVSSVSTNFETQYPLNFFQIDADGAVKPRSRIELGEFPLGAGLFTTSTGYLVSWGKTLFAATTNRWVVKGLNTSLDVFSSEELPNWQDASVLLSDGTLAGVSHEQVFLGDFGFLQYRGANGGFMGESERSGVLAGGVAAGFANDVWLSARDPRPGFLPTLVHFSAEGKIVSKTIWGFPQIGSYFRQLLPEPGNRLKAVAGGPGAYNLVQLSMDEVPAGTPQIFINDDRRLAYSFTDRTNYFMAIEDSDTNAQLFYTLDGSTNLSGAIPFPRPSILELRQSAVLRALAVGTNGVVLPSRAIRVDFFPNYVVVLNTPGGGIVSPWSGAGYLAQFSSNAPVNVIAGASEGWQFARWIGDFAGKGNQFTFNVQSNVQATALFSTSLTTAVLGNGHIVTDRSPQTYEYGATARLAAFPDEGYYFANWQPTTSGLSWFFRPSTTYTVTEANPGATAVFNPLPNGEVALTVVENGNGAVTSSVPPGAVAQGTHVSLRAVPDAGSRFLGWTGAVTNDSPEITLDLTKSLSVIASFSRGIPALSPPFIEMNACPIQGGVTIQLSSVPGAIIEVEQSTDWRAWAPFGTFTLTNGFLELPISPGTNRLFFRSRFSQ